MGPRIAIDARFIDNPGIGRYINRLLASLPSDLDILAVVTPETKATTREVRPDISVAVTKAQPFGLREQIALPALLTRRGADCFHATQFTVPVLWRGPLVTTIHDCAYDRYPSEFGGRSVFAKCYYRMMMRTAISHSDFVISVSENTKRDIISLYDGDPESIRTIYEGVEVDQFSPALPEPTDVESPYLLYVGSTRPRKNITGLLNGYLGALRRLDDCPPLVLVGEHSDRFIDLEAAIAARDLQESIVRPGYVSDDELRRLYAHALAFVFPSLYEGFGLPVLEAMAAGTPVITTDAASLPEVCGDAAKYIDPTDASDIAAGIVEIASDAGIRDRLRAAGLERVRHFRWETTAAETTAIYDELC